MSARGGMLRGEPAGASGARDGAELVTDMKAKYYRSWHLAESESSFKVTEFEWTMIRFYEAFARCVSTIGALTTDVDLKFSEHLILHVIRMQDRPKNSATIARMINRDDIPNIQYSLRKLESANLIQKTPEKSGKTFAYAVTLLGEKVTEEYASVRAEMLLENLGTLVNFDGQVTKMTQLLGVMTGIYEEAARNSATLSKGD